VPASSLIIDANVGTPPKVPRSPIGCARTSVDEKILLLLLLFFITRYTGSTRTQTTQTQTAKIHVKYKNVNTNLKAPS